MEPPLDSSGSARSGEIDLVPKHLSMSDSMIEKIGEDMGPKHLSLSDSMLEKIEEEKLLLRQEMETMRKEMQTLKRRYFG